MESESFVSSSVEELSPISKRITVSIRSDHVEEQFKSAIAEAVKSASLKGFRPGKAPADMVEKLHGARVRLEVTDKLISSSLNDVVRKNELDVVGSPELQIDSMEPGKDLQYSATLALFPRPDISGYEAFTVKVAKHEVTDKEVDEQIERIRVSKGTVRPLADRTSAQKGDVVRLQLQVDLEGKEPSRAEPATLVIGENRLPTEVEESIIGMEVGQSKEVTSQIPDTYRDEALRGAKATYKLTLESLAERILPEVDDGFAKSLAPEIGSLLELRLKIRESIEKEYAEREQADAETAMLDQLVERNQFEAPQALLDDEIRSMLVRMGAIDPKKTDVNKLPIEKLRSDFHEMALKRVRTAIVVDRIGQTENLTATEDEIKTRVKELADASQVSETEAMRFLSKEGRLVSLMLEITRTKVIKFLMTRTKVEYEAAKA